MAARAAQLDARLWRDVDAFIMGFLVLARAHGFHQATQLDPGGHRVATRYQRRTQALAARAWRAFNNPAPTRAMTGEKA